MLPVLVNIGSVVIRSFGLFLFLAFLACLFVIWKRSREEGFSEEKVLDVFFLSTLVFIILGRFGFIVANLPLFQEDFGRVILLFRYPGLSFPFGLLAFSVTAYFLARLYAISALRILDVFALGLTLATGFWFFGCFLDGCTVSSPFLPVIFSGLFVLGFALLRFFTYKVKHSSDLVEFSRRPGAIGLCYLIFLSISSLISSYVLGERLSDTSIVVVILSIGTFIFRYFTFLKGVTWSSFPKAFLARLAAISKRGGKILKRS